MNPKRILLAVFILLASPSAAKPSERNETLYFGLPGFPITHMDSTGRLREEWGDLRLTLQGKDVPPAGNTTLQGIMLDGVIPAVRAVTPYGTLTLTCTAFRAPAWPAGLDVLVAEVHETAGRTAKALLSFELPPKAQIGSSTISVGGKPVLALPQAPPPKKTEREWGCATDAQVLPGWAKPSVECDPAFRNIRAGMGGIPIIYRFPIEKKASVQVILGICESHWAMAGQRPLICAVEGAPRQEVDPIAKWGRHKPGVLIFDAKDDNGDAKLDIAVLPKPGSKDLNPILNVIWLFQPGLKLDLTKVIAGHLNAVALRYVDVGGERDQALYVTDKLEYELTVPPSGRQEISFILACKGATVPTPDRSSWTPYLLRKASLEFWEEWFSQGARISLPDPQSMQSYYRALAEMGICRVQCDGYFVPLPRPGGIEAFDPRAFLEINQAFALAGFFTEAERNFRILWDSPLPKPFAHLAQGKDGPLNRLGEDNVQAYLRRALARHVALAPSVSPILSRVIQEAKPLVIDSSPAAPTTPQARIIFAIRNAIIQEDGEQLLFLPDIKENWVIGAGLHAVDLPTLFGLASISAKAADGKLDVFVRVPPHVKKGKAILCLPQVAGKLPAHAEVNGAQIPIKDDRLVLPCAGGTTLATTLIY